MPPAHNPPSSASPRELECESFSSGVKNSPCDVSRSSFGGRRTPHGGSLKRTPLDTISQNARQAALLQIRKAERDRVMAGSRIARPFVRPPDTPVGVDVVCRETRLLLQKLEEALSAHSLPALANALENLCQKIDYLNRQLAAYPQMLEEFATSDDAASRGKTADPSAVSADVFSLDSMATLLADALRLARTAKEFVESQGRCGRRLLGEAASGVSEDLRLLERLHAIARTLQRTSCGCLVVLTNVALPPEEGIETLVRELQECAKEKRAEGEGAASLEGGAHLRHEAVCALSSVAASFPATCFDLGLFPVALDFAHSACAELEQTLRLADREASGEGERADVEEIAEIPAGALRAAWRLLACLQRSCAEAASSSPGLRSLQLCALRLVLSYVDMDARRGFSCFPAFERRLCAAEGLWCLVAIVESLVLPMQNSHSAPRHAESFVAAPELLLEDSLLASVLNSALRLGEDLVRDRVSSSAEGEKEASSFEPPSPTDGLFNSLVRSKADGLVPLLRLLSELRLLKTQTPPLPPCKGRPNSGEACLAYFGGPEKPRVAEILKPLLRPSEHRGVLLASLIQTACFAAGPPDFEVLVLPLLPYVAAVLAQVSAFDILREAAACILHASLNHNKKLLETVLALEPSPLISMLHVLDACKYDRASVEIALDFLAGVLESVPSARRTVYRHDGIERIEAVQFLHDKKIDGLSSWIVSKYFDCLTEDEEDEAAPLDANLDNSPPKFDFSR